jgi:hypothetical protein
MKLVVVESSCLDEALNDDLVGSVWFDLTEFVTYQASEVWNNIKIPN